jgi:hypothetical protein
MEWDKLVSVFVVPALLVLITYVLVYRQKLKEIRFLATKDAYVEVMKILQEWSKKAQISADDAHDEGSLICRYLICWGSDEINRLWKKSWESERVDNINIMTLIKMLRKELLGCTNLKEDEMLLVINPGRRTATEKPRPTP